MEPKKRKRTRKEGKHREPPVKIPLPFERLVEGVLAISPEDAKDVREKTKPKK
jgi:hypothetical protein